MVQSDMQWYKYSEIFGSLRGVEHKLEIDVRFVKDLLPFGDDSSSFSACRIRVQGFSPTAENWSRCEMLAIITSNGRNVLRLFRSETIGERVQIVGTNEDAGHVLHSGILGERRLSCEFAILVCYAHHFMSTTWIWQLNPSQHHYRSSSHIFVASVLGR